jgi:DNA-binding NarL/FixJ family response regulator
MAAETWQMSDPWRLHPDHPVVDDDSAEILDDAVHNLTMNRSPLNDGHAGLRLHVLASLIAQAQALLPDAVADARDQGFSWSDIANDLGISASTARRHYRHYATARRLPLDPD